MVLDNLSSFCRRMWSFYLAGIEYECQRVVCIGAVGGLLAGTLGLGGGVIFNPALMTLGFHAQVSSATGMFLVIFSVLSSVITNIVAENFKIDYSLWLGLFSILASVFGTFIGDLAVKKRKGKVSVLIWVLFFVFVLTVSSSIYSGVKKFQTNKATNAPLWKFSTIC